MESGRNASSNDRCDQAHSNRRRAGPQRARRRRNPLSVSFRSNRQTRLRGLGRLRIQTAEINSGRIGLGKAIRHPHVVVSISERKCEVLSRLPGGRCDSRHAMLVEPESKSSLAGRLKQLTLREIGKGARSGDQLVVVSGLHDLASGQHDDAIGLAHGA